MEISFITDPLVTTMGGAVRPAILLAKEFHSKGHDVTIVTTRFNTKVENVLQAEGIHLRATGPKFSYIRSFPTLDAWTRCLIRRKTLGEVSHSNIVINTSSCIMDRADVYYAQGLMTRTLSDMFHDMPLQYKYAHYLFAQVLKALERDQVQRFRHLSKLFTANSAFCASMYRKWNIEVDEIIYPPLDCGLFKPTTSKPTGDYVLTHFGTHGKEGKFSVIKAIADSGVAIKAFGNASSVPKPLTRHSNIDFLGRVTDEELPNLYSNALYTLFAFNHEPFGYVPVESMACGSPVLTYNKQGPSETVVDGKTGWLRNTDKELYCGAVNVWNNGYDKNMRTTCRARALVFDTKQTFKRWRKILSKENLLTD